VLALAAPVAAQPQSRERTIAIGTGSRIGVSVREVRDADLTAAKLPRLEGVFVESVQPGAPAERAGIRAGDIVMEYDGERVRGVRHFTRLVQETPAGRSIQLAVNRAGTREALNVTPEEGRLGSVDLGEIRERVEREVESLPFGLGQRAGERRLGVTLIPLSAQLAAHFKVPGGVLVSEVVTGSPAAQAKIQAGDIIRTVNGRTVDSPREVTQELRAVGTGTSIGLILFRGGQEVKVSVRMEDSRNQRRGATGI
jgi:serine protease Do